MARDGRLVQRESNMMRFDNKIAIVTGGSKGIGAGICERLASEGAMVVLNYKSSADRARTVADRIIKAGGKVDVQCGDMGDAASISHLVEYTVATYGRIDILCANAGNIGPMKPVSECVAAEYDDCFDLNVRGTFLLSRAVLPYMIANRSGRIINTSSIFGKRGWPNYGIYCASKAAVIALTQSIALEVAKQNITANCICPGVTESDMLVHETEFWAARSGISVEAMHAEWLKGIPLGRPQTADEQAALVAFLASEEAAYITGVAISSAGGMELS